MSSVPSDPFPPSQETVETPPEKPAQGRPAHKAPEHIGPFRILEKIGEGGMGIVYKAEQREPVRRIVALKVIKLGMDTKEVVARFEAERQALAMLAHPNVARVFEAGMTENGRPYFAMEHVPGIPLTQYCDEHQLTTKQRLDLFIPICQAVQHAHQKGIIHRDLKPNNILIMLVDGKPVPKVIDFGIAKATNHALTQHTLFTQTGALIGTPEYMSPEQAQTSGLDVDTRTDIFSLGVILYELLTGTLPLDPKSLREAGLEGMARMIRTSEPQRPSTRLTTLAGSAKPDTFTGRTRDLRAMQKELRGDLDWIVLKAIEKDRSRRYETANALAMDIQRHMNYEPVVARPPSTAYRLQKAFRRNRLAFVASGLVLTALILGVCVSAWQAVRATRAQRLASDNETKANQSATQARQSQQEADQARAASEAEAYRAVLSESRALRAGREPGWREKALADLSRLATTNSPNRNMLELRTEAAAAVGTPDVQLIAQFETSRRGASFAFDADGQAIAIVGSRSELDFWNVQELKHIATADALALKVAESDFASNKVVYLPGGQGLAVTTPDRGVVFTDRFGKRTPRPPITSGTAVPLRLAVDTAGSRLAVAWRGADATVHDMASGQLIERVQAGVVALSPDGQWLALTAPNFEVRLRQIGSQDPEKLLGHQGGINKLAFSRDGKVLGGTSGDGTAILWDVSGVRQPVILRGHREGVRDLAFSPDGGWIATASTDFTARIWDAATGQSLATLPAGWFVFDVGWSADGNFLAATGGATGNSPVSIWLYRVTGRHIFQRLAAHRNGIQCVTASPHLDRIASGADDHTVINWDLAAPHPSARWRAPEPQFVTALAYSPDGALLASGTGGTYAGHLVVRDAETGEVKVPLAGHEVGIYSFAFDPSGRRLASGGRNGQVILWDLATQQPVQQLQVGPSFVWSIVFLDDGRKLVAEVSNGPVVLFDLKSGRKEKEITLPGGIRRFIVDPARNRLIVAFNNGDLSELSIPDLTPGRRLEHAHPSAIESVALSPDGRLLVTGGADRRAVFRDPVTFEPLLALPAWTAMVKDLAFTPSGRWLAYVGADSDVALWDLRALHEGLEARGLAWDQSAPAAIAATSRPAAAAGATAEVPVLRFTSDGVDLASLEQARQLRRSGNAAYKNGRLAEARSDLEQARDRLRPLHKAAPASHQVASELGECLLSLGKALRDQRSAAEAVASFKQGSEVPEALGEPAPTEFYTLACTYAQLAALLEPAPAGVSERQAMADRAMDALRRSIAADYDIFANIEGDKDLDPLRQRPDFRALMAGGLREIIPDMAKMSAANPTDTELSIKVAALQAWFGQEKEFAATRQRLLALARDTNDSNTADRAAKACSLMPNSDKAQLDAAMALAKAALKLDQRKQWEDWELMALGMAEYRAGNYADAEKTLAAATAAGAGNPQVTGISAFYRAMSLQRQGKADEARKVAVAATAEMKPLPVDELKTLGDATHDDLILWLAYKEAKALIQFDAAPPKAENEK